MKTLLLAVVVVSTIVIGLTIRANVTEYTNEEVIEPAVELTAEEKYQEAKAALETEIEALEAEQAAIEAEIERKKGLIGALPD